jgi:hypothetical protein
VKTTTTTAARLAIANGRGRVDYGKGGFDTFSRWTSLILAAFVGLLATLGATLGRAHRRRLPDVIETASD